MLSFFIYFFYVSSAIQVKILHTPFLKFVPAIKLHHLVVLSKPDMTKEVYTLDFSPRNQSSKHILLRLFLANNVDAEVRIRHIKNIEMMNSTAIIQQWNDNNQGKTEKESRELSEVVFQQIEDEEIKMFIGNIRENMNEEKKNIYNLYTFNCQHFSGFVKKYIDTY